MDIAVYAKDKSMREPDEITQYLVDVQRGGDAFEPLYNVIAGHIADIARFNLNNKSLIPDAVSETFARIWTHIRSFNPEHSGYNWVYKITQHVCWTINHNERLHTGVSIDDLPVRDPVDRYDRAETKMDLTCAIRQLDKTNRKIAILKYYRDYSQRKIAKILHMSPSAVCQRVTRIREFIEKFFKEN